MKKNILIVLLIFSTSLVTAQGQSHAKVFANFNYDLSAEEMEDGYKEFELKRAYLGYGYNINEDFSAKVTFDVGSNDAGSSYTAFLKIAALTWKASENLIINFGQVGTKNFKFMEKAWGKRYIYKSLQDQNKWANPADLGATMDYKIGSGLSIDAQILNGEGYKNTQSENGLFRGSFGLTYKMGDMGIRIVRDMNPRSVYYPENTYDVQYITTIAMSYDMGSINVGGEYNMQENAGNIIDNTKTGISLYGNMRLMDDISLFGRYDDLSSEDADGSQWNLDKDGSLIIFGIERKMAKGVTASINVQSWTDATLEGSEEAEAQNTLYLNLEYKF